MRQVLCVDYWARGGSCWDQAAAAVACQPPDRLTLRAKYNSSSAPGAAPQRLSRVFLVPPCALAVPALSTARARGQALRSSSSKIKFQSTFPGSTLENIKGLSQSSLPGDEVQLPTLCASGWLEKSLKLQILYCYKAETPPLGAQNYHLKRFSKCGPPTSNVSIIWELLRKANSQAPAQAF